VKLAVDLHHGRVNVVSKEGEGSRFTVHLPKTLMMAESPSPLDATEMTEA